MRIALDIALFATFFALPFAARWWRLRRWGLPVRITVDPDDPRPSVIAGYLAEVARRLDERPERMRVAVEAANVGDRAIALDFTPEGDMTVSVEGHRSRKMDLRRRWIPEHPVPLVLWSRKRRRNVRLYVDPVDANRFRVMSSVPWSPPSWLYVACSLLATLGAVVVSPECVVVAIDVKARETGFPSGYEVVIAGGTKPTGIDALEWAKQAESLGAGEILLTSMDKDGTKSGYDNKITSMISEAVGIPVIASGGAGSMKDFRDAVVDGKADAVLAASLFHFGEIKISDLKDYLEGEGIPVRKIAPSLDMWAHMKKNSDGMVPAITQDSETGEVLMMAYMNYEAFNLTCETGYMHYYSRSRDTLWKKGETSGHVQKVVSCRIDCDRDTLLYTVEQTGAACHTGNKNCFYTALEDWDLGTD